MPPAMPAPAISGGSATTASVVRMLFAIEAAFCSAERVTHRRIDDPGLDQVFDFVRVDVDPFGKPASTSGQRRRADSNRCTGLCRPLPNLSATAPGEAHRRRPG